jgi:hypothetical protein
MGDYEMRQKSNTKKQAISEELAQEAAAWANRANSLSGWEEAPDAVPRQAESTAISIRMPTNMLTIIRELARRRGIGYQMLMKQWFEECIQEASKPYLARLRKERRAAMVQLERELLECCPSKLKLDSDKSSPELTRIDRANNWGKEI